MRFQITAVIASLALLVSAAPSQTDYCPDQTQMCCQNFQETGNVGYYCATPNQQFPCQETLTSMCCETYDLTPRGYTGSNCKIITI
ncbi:hypothetical protein BKA70DRAFT_1558628 [Coprinopsis sp. MPI-PUGE-AT-0042]|nr:hypothetical protein BKA70DRAFT_1558628 [Coprinopsis sp. MPI-PUGE-AT-0042]